MVEGCKFCCTGLACQTPALLPDLRLLLLLLLLPLLLPPPPPAPLLSPVAVPALQAASRTCKGPRACPFRLRRRHVPEAFRVFRHVPEFFRFVRHTPELFRLWRVARIAHASAEAMALATAKDQEELRQLAARLTEVSGRGPSWDHTESIGIRLDNGLDIPASRQAGG